MSDAIFHVTGGLGKHVLFSSVVNSYKKQYPHKRIVVSSAYPAIFHRNPNVGESLDLNKQQYFYKKYIHGKNVEIFAQEPYRTTSHMVNRRNLTDTWCDLVGVDKTCPPSLHFNYREREIVARRMSQYREKPVLVFQPFGGPLNQELKYCWARDIHPELAQGMVDTLKGKYDIIHICNPNHPVLDGAIRVDERMHPHIMFLILAFSDKRILVDSSLQHAASVMGLESTVFWVVTSPKQFGHDIHTNILPETVYSEGTADSYFFDYEITGIIPECPYADFEEIFPRDSTLFYLKETLLD